MPTTKKPRFNLSLKKNEKRKEKKHKVRFFLGYLIGKKVKKREINYILNDIDIPNKKYTKNVFFILF